MLGETAESDPTIEPLTESAWRAFTQLSFNRGARDFTVAERAGSIIAYATSTLLPGDPEPLRHFRILVHTSHRQRGVGTRMLKVIESQDRDAETILQSTCPGTWLAGQAFLAHHGFRRYLRDLQMERWGPPPEPGPQLPSEIDVRSYRATPEDDAAWIRLHEVSYRAAPDYAELTLNDLSLERLAEGFGLWLAERNDVAIGFCHTVLWQGRRPLVKSLVVDPRFRRLGVGRALMVAGLQTLAESSAGTVGLSVRADNLAAFELYRSLGFTVTTEETTWRKNPG